MIYEKNRQTELLIDLNAMGDNYNKIREINPKKQILPVLKASGYGIGAKNVAKFIKNAEINIIGTALVDEGIVLRAGYGYNGEIIVLNQPAKEDIDNIVKYDITVGICYIEFAEILNEIARRNNKKAKIHIEIETGMGRTGVQIDKLDVFIEKIKKLSNIIVEGIYTHFATSDSDLNFAKLQESRFNEAVKMIKNKIKEIKYIHIANSAAIINLKNTIGNMIRPRNNVIWVLSKSKPERKNRIKTMYEIKKQNFFYQGSR